MRTIILIAHNIRSTHNVGSLLRTAEGLGLSKVYLTGYTPYPKLKQDKRLPHLANKIHAQIAKTALGAEEMVDLVWQKDIHKVIDLLKTDSFMVYALEQSQHALDLKAFKPPDKVALIVGREVDGIESDILKVSDGILQIPMFGQKESFNVAVAAAMALYHIRFN